MRGEASRAPVTAAAMPCNCFGKKDKKASAAAEKYSLPEQEPLAAPSPAPAPVQTAVQAPAPAQTEAAPATPPTPVTPTSGDPRLRPEDDPDKASRRRDVVASFYSDQCELIGFKATGSRPPSAVVGGAGEGPAAISSPLGSPPSSSRTSALSRADLALKRREFFKDLAVNDMSSSRYGASQPSWRMVDSGSLTTPRRTHHDGPQHHTLPLHVRTHGIVLRPVSSPMKGTSTPDINITNGHVGNNQEQGTDNSRVPEGEPLLDAGPPQDPVAHYPEAGAEEPLLSSQQSGGDQFTAAIPATPPVTPATPPPTPPVGAEPLLVDVPSPDQPPATEAPIEPAATHSESSNIPPQREGQLVVQQQYVQQVSVPSDDERLDEGSCILITEAFPEEPRADLKTSSLDVPDTTNASGASATPPASHEASRDVSQHSSEQPTTPPPTQPPLPSQRRPSFPEEEEEREEGSLRYTDEAALNTDQDLKRPTSSPETSAPGSPQEPRQPLGGETPATAAPEQQHDPPHPQQESADSSEEARLSPTIVGCIPKAAPTQEADPRTPSPPETPPTAHPSSPPTPHAGEETRPPAPLTTPSIHDPAPPSPTTPPSLSEPRMTCGVDVSSSPLEDDGLGSDIDDALSSLECLTEEGNSEKRATAST